MRVVLVLLLFILISFQPDKAVVKKWVIQSGCSLKVDGSTNINTFSCQISDYGKPDTIIATSTAAQQVQLNGNIKLDIQHFDCGNPIMTADLRKTLKSEKFPQLMIYFANLTKYPESKQNIKGTVVIVLAGVSKRFDVDYKVSSADNNFINFTGYRKINFSDFNLTPPRKLGGMIKTNNELSVVFNLRMKVLN